MPNSSIPTQKNVRVAGIVLKWIRGAKDINYRRIEPMIREAASGGAQLVCTTECFLDGCSAMVDGMQGEEYRAMGEAIPGGEYFQKLSALSKELGIYLIAGLHEDGGENQLNSAALIGPDGDLVGKYHKQFLVEELSHHTPGKESLTFATSLGQIGIMICKDRTDAALVKRFVSNGCDFLICVSGGAFGPERNHHYLQDRSRENGIYIVFVHPAEFLVTAPDGEICAQTLLGDPALRGRALVISQDQMGTDVDRNRVFFFDLPL